MQEAQMPDRTPAAPNTPYAWTHRPLELKESWVGSGPWHLPFTEMENAEVILHPADIPRSCWAMYGLNEDHVQADLEDREAGQERYVQEDLVGFWLSRDADQVHPRPQDVFVFSRGPNEQDRSAFTPGLGKDTEKRWQVGDFFISVHDYLAISAPHETPEVFVCEKVRRQDPYAVAASWRPASWSRPIARTAVQPPADTGFELLQQDGACYYRVTDAARRNLPDTSDTTPEGPFPTPEAALSALMERIEKGTR